MTTETTKKVYKRYIGDSVYVDFDGYHIVLTTEDGISISNTIYLEPSVYRDLTMYVEALIAKLEAQEDDNEPSANRNEPEAAT